MKAGRLRHRVRIDAVINGVDAFGAPMKVWTQIAEVQASKESTTTVLLVKDEDLPELTKEMLDTLYANTLKKIESQAYLVLNPPQVDLTKEKPIVSYCEFVS